MIIINNKTSNDKTSDLLSGTKSGRECADYKILYLVTI